MSEHLDITGVRTKHFNLWYIKGNKGDSAALKYPSKADPEYGLIESGSYYRIRPFIVVLRGSFEQDYIEGPRRLRPYGDITKEFHRSGPYITVAREDDSLMVCFTPIDRTIHWGKERIELNKGETYTIGEDEHDVVFYPAEGDMKIEGKRTQLDKVYNLTQNKPYTVECNSNKCVFVYAYNNGEYIPEIVKDPDLSDEIFLEEND